MTDSLPVVPKAQPPKQLVCWGCGEDTYTTFRDKRFCGKDCLADHYFSEGYSEAAARYEKREQQLKNKIKRIAIHGMPCVGEGGWGGDNCRICVSAKELLELSKL